MNPNIDLANFSSGHTSNPTSAVAPPRRLISRVVLPAALLLGFAGVTAYSMRDSLRRTIPVRVVMPVLGRADAEPAAGSVLFQAPGWVEPDPFSVHVSALTPGVVTAVHVREGQEVLSGTLVAELMSTDAELGVAKAESVLKRRRAELAAARMNWEHPVTLTEALRTAQAERTKLHAEKTNAQESLELARKQAQYEEQLSRTGAGARFPAQTAALQAKTAESNLRKIEAELQLADEIVSAALQRSSLRIDDKLKVELADADLCDAEVALEEARLRLERCRIKAPTSGTIMRLFVSPGSQLSDTQPGAMRIVSMYNPAKLQVRAEIPMADAAKIRHGLPAEIRVDAVPDRIFRGELTRVVHEADVQRNTLQVKVKILDPDPALKPEMIARVQFMEPAGERPKKSSESTTDAVMIPQALLPAGADEAKLWVVGPDGAAHQRTVKPGKAGTGDLRAVSGVNATDKIIISGSEKLKEGSRVSIAAD